tara:strand:+ start:379 stop:618 length:240 start_codon:yes stop_codon:yes gene_type:complete
MKQKNHKCQFKPGEKVLVCQDDKVSMAVVKECTCVPTVKEKGYWIDVQKYVFGNNQIHRCWELTEGIPSYIIAKKIRVR